jgi:hypothetical protein
MGIAALRICLYVIEYQVGQMYIAYGTRDVGRKVFFVSPFFATFTFWPPLDQLVRPTLHMSILKLFEYMIPSRHSLQYLV